ncbi:MAG: TIGR02186 family protein [Alphaproteobacteria bacterium]
MLITLALLTGCLFVSTGARAQQPLVADLDTHQIAIRSTFTGTELLLFGAIEAAPGKSLAGDERGDVIIVVRGPASDITVRKKSRVGPIWVNTEAVTFDTIPGFYAVLSTRPLDQIAPAPLLRRHDLGIERVLAGTKIDEAHQEFRSALVRTRKADGLFIEDHQGFRFVGGKLFRARISLPANVPVGTYKVQAFLIRDGQVAGAQFSPLFVDKVGVELQIYRLAHNLPWLYGLMAVLLAVAAGWGTAILFRER